MITKAERLFFGKDETSELKFLLRGGLIFLLDLVLFIAGLIYCARQDYDTLGFLLLLVFVCFTVVFFAAGNQRRNKLLKRIPPAYKTTSDARRLRNEKPS